MNKYAVFSDSACDLPNELVKEHNIEIVPFRLSFDKKTMLTEGVNITNLSFYKMLESTGSMPKTYFPSVGDYVSRFKKRLDQGQDILCVCLSAKLSKSYNSAVNAQQILSYTYPKNKIMVIDSMMASIGQGLLVMDAVKLNGTMSITDVCGKLDAVKKNSLSVVTVASLNQLARGGRMSATAALFGKLLHVNPIIYMTGGMLVSKDKAIGRRKALDKIKSLTAQEMGGNYGSYDFSLMHSRALTEANAVASDMKTAYGIIPTIPPVELGATIGMHTGASVVATYFVKKV